MLRQPGGIAWSVFDARIAPVARQFEDFRNAERTGAIVTRQSVQALADVMRVPPEAFAAELTETEALKTNAGQDRMDVSLRPGSVSRRRSMRSRSRARCFIRRAVSLIDAACRVKRKDDTVFPICLRPAALQLACQVRRRRVICLETAF